MEDRIRPYADADASRVADCLTHGASLDATLLPLSEEEWRGFASRPFNNGAKDFMVAERDGSIVGVLMSTRVERDGEQLRSFRIIVHPEHRRRGIGARMLEAVEDQDPDHDAVLRAELLGKWKAGARMLGRHGFEVAEHVLWMRADAVPPDPPIPEGFELRPYRPGPDDDRAWRRINREAYEGTSDFTDLIAAEREAIRNEPGFFMWLAERDGEVVGLCHTKQFSEKSYVNSIVVVNNDRGRGVGRALLGAGMRTLHEQAPGAPIYLNVRAENVSAVALYRSAGFVVEDSLHEWQKRR